MVIGWGLSLNVVDVGCWMSLVLDVVGLINFQLSDLAGHDDDGVTLNGDDDNACVGKKDFCAG